MNPNSTKKTSNIPKPPVTMVNLSSGSSSVPSTTMYPPLNTLSQERQESIKKSTKYTFKPINKLSTITSVELSKLFKYYLFYNENLMKQNKKDVCDLEKILTTMIGIVVDVL